MYWAIFGLFHSIFRAAAAQAGKDAAADPWRLAFWQALCGVAVFLPLLPFMHWPGDLDFSFAAVFAGLILAVGHIIQINLNIARIGRVSAVSMPLEAFLGFALWLAVFPAARDIYLANPGAAVVTIAVFALAAGGLFYIRRNDVTLRTFLIAAPVGFSYAVAGVVTKLAVPAGFEIGAGLSFILISQLAMAGVVFAVVMLKARFSPAILDKETVRTGFLTGMFGAAAYATFVLGVVFAPNPGFVSFLAILVPVWLMWYHEMRLRGDRANPVAALLIVISVLTLIGMDFF